MEKYIWTIRALEDEWAKFANSDEYKKLPENLTEKNAAKKIYGSNQKLTDAVTAYRRSMNYLTA